MYHCDTISPYQIRGQDAFIPHHTFAVLWAYTMMMNGHAKSTAINVPAREQVQRQTLSREDKVLFFDDPPSSNSSAVDASLFKSAGLAFLHFPAPVHRHATAAAPSQFAASASDVCDLRSPPQIMMIGVATLKATHPDVDRENGPPLMRALCGLMEELWSLR